MGHELSLHLRQSQGFRKSLVLDVKEGDLHVNWRNGPNEYRNRLPMDVLDENTMSFWKIGGLWRAGGVTALVLGGVLAVIWLSTLDQRAVGYGHSLGVAAAICFVLAAAFAAIGRARMRERIILFSRVDGSQLLVLHADSPSRHDVREFLGPVLDEARRLTREMEEQALLSHERYNTATEIRKFHQLRIDGALDDGEFARKKRSLLEGFLKE